jgi:hypothetical protein
LQNFAGKAEAKMKGGRPRLTGIKTKEHRRERLSTIDNLGQLDEH